MISVFQNSENSGYEYQVAPDMGDDSQNDNDTSLRSWRSTRQRLESYDTDKQSVP